MSLYGLDFQMQQQRRARHQRLDARLELLVRLAIRIEVLHVVHARELQGGDKVVALIALVLQGAARVDGQDIWLAILCDCLGVFVEERNRVDAPPTRSFVLATSSYALIMRGTSSSFLTLKQACLWIGIFVNDY